MNSTRYAAMARRPALLILACAVCFTALCLALAPPETVVPKQSENTGPSDMDIYQKVVQRVHGGEGYYGALGSELRTNRRPTTAIVNWRTPLHLMTFGIGAEPDVAANSAGGLCSSRCGDGPGNHATLQHAVPGDVPGNSHDRGVGVVFCRTGPVLRGGVGRADDCLIDRSLRIRLDENGSRTGIARPIFPRAGSAVCTGLRLSGLPQEKLRPEVLAWSLGVVAYVVYFSIHAATVLSRILPGDVSNPVSWIQFGGVKLLVTTSSMGALAALPPWVTALYLPAALLGLAGWKDPVALRVSATVAAYLGIFAVVGLPVNIYWGAMYAPLLTFGVAWSVPAVWDLVSAATVKRAEMPQNLVSSRG